METAGSILEHLDQTRIHNLASGRYWKLLLHWEKPLIGSLRSGADGPEFFFSPEGRNDPEKELIADVLAFGNPDAKGVGPIKQHPQCAFPERFRYLKEQLHLNVIQKDCVDFKKWKAGFNPKSLTLVYAAPFFGSPASMFGHTFLRVDSNPRPGHFKKNDLLDYGISFEADTGINPGPAYAVKGLLGLYHGIFLQQPYYMKINNYVNMESRDLWEYELNLSDEQIDRMLNHTWEMGITYFNYYFFNKNCSYELLSLLEVANPEWRLKENFKLMTIPGDTIRALKKIPGAVRKVRLRPALTRILQEELKTLNDSEVERFYLVRNDHLKLSNKETIGTLDALLDWDKFRAMKELKAVYDPEQNIDKKLLVARATAGTANATRTSDKETEIFEIKEGDIPPEEGHGSSKFSIFAGAENSLSLGGFELRPVFQDILDPDEGYLSHSSLVIGRVRASYLFTSVNSGQNFFRLDDFTVADVVNLVALTRFQPKLSWRIGGGVFHPVDIECINCEGVKISAGGGLGFQVSDSNPEIFLYSLIDPHFEISNGFSNLYGNVSRFGVSLEDGVLIKLSSRVKSLLSFESFWYSAFSGSPSTYWSKSSAEISVAFLPIELRLTSEFFFLQNQSYWRVLTSFGWYY